ncbi:hypothetical protein FRACYDRAFT_267156 [Fragilariopsis cylindrus CCMP1102]|uniref:PDZ domain-containing protein n=1 Tax=Fragilariopsis cylindrus CCMP1102 TaxID=635003 RepID=A0A1E7FVB2_9STRA|nr:hypothetical protein FRACYDRAFT_267156 [Fragilariopsis cylindrus CCMP1102]|eukprot:OEU22100.1 hypothetical protein FRACYDRAFT_267156 [Fragilariopsis cylindrus CCMP1102]
MTGQEMRVHVKRNSKKKSGYEVEKREDGFFYVTSVPSKKSSIQPGDRLLEINGIKYTEFKTVKRANDLFDTMVLDVEPNDDETDSDEEGSDSESKGESESESQNDE